MQTKIQLTHKDVCKGVAALTATPLASGVVAASVGSSVVDISSVSSDAVVFIAIRGIVFIAIRSIVFIATRVVVFIAIRSVVFIAIRGVVSIDIRGAIVLSLGKF